MILEIPMSPLSIVKRVTVMISEYSEENGGSDNGTLYAVEVLFPDGTSPEPEFFRDLKNAKSVAEQEAKSRNAVLVKKSLWPNRVVSEDD